MRANVTGKCRASNGSVSVSAERSMQYAVAEIVAARLFSVHSIDGGSVAFTLDAAVNAADPGSGMQGTPDELVGKKAMGMGKFGWASRPRFPGAMCGAGRGGADDPDPDAAGAAGEAPIPLPLPVVFGVPFGRLVGVELALVGGAMLAGEGSICGFFPCTLDVVNPDPSAPDSAEVIAEAMSC
jgi:hypothetical protein